MRKLLAAVVLIGFGVVQSAFAIRTDASNLCYVRCPACQDVAAMNNDPEAYLRSFKGEDACTEEEIDKELYDIMVWRLEHLGKMLVPKKKIDEQIHDADCSDSDSDSDDSIAMLADEGRYEVFMKIEETMNNPKMQNLAKLFRDQNFSKIQDMIENGKIGTNNVQVRFVCCGGHTTCYDGSFVHCCERASDGMIWHSEKIDGDEEFNYSVARVHLSGYCQYLKSNVASDLESFFSEMVAGKKCEKADKELDFTNCGKHKEFSTARRPDDCRCETGLICSLIRTYDNFPCSRDVKDMALGRVCSTEENGCLNMEWVEAFRDKRIMLDDANKLNKWLKDNDSAGGLS